MKKKYIRYIVESVVVVLIIIAFVIINHLVDNNKAERCEVRGGRL